MAQTHLATEIKKQEAEAKKWSELIGKISSGSQKIIDIPGDDIVQLHYFLKDQGNLASDYIKKQVEQRYQEIAFQKTGGSSEAGVEDLEQASPPEIAEGLDMSK